MKRKAKNIMRLIGAIAILAIGLPFIFNVISSDVNNNTSISGQVEVDPNYVPAFVGVRVLKENGNTTETYTANLSYRVNASSPYEACVSLGSATSTNIIIPSFYSDGSINYDIVAIDYSGFANSETITSCTFLDANKIRIIDAQAFACNPKLNKFNSTTIGTCTVPANTTKIYPSAFLDDMGFTSLTFGGAALTEIGSNAFNGCIAVTSSLLFKSGLTTIGDSAFANCYSMANFMFPTGLTSIGNNAFYNCRGAKILALPATISSVGTDAFRLCTSATAYIGSASRYPAGWPSDGADSGNDTIGSGSVTSADWNYASTAYAIPIITNSDNIMSNGDYLYTSNWVPAYNIYKVTVISYIGAVGATSLTVPSVLPVMNVAGQTNALIDSNTGTEYGIVTIIGSNAFLATNSSLITTLTLPNTLETINSSGFVGCTKLTTLTMNDKNTDSSFTIGSDIKSMDDYGLTGLTSIGSSAFNVNSANKVKVTVLTIPSTVVSIDDNAFYNFDYLETLVFTPTSSIQHIGTDAFYRAGYSAANKGTCDLILPASLATSTAYPVSIEPYAFTYAYFIKSVTFANGGAGTNIIDSYAFNHCIHMQYAVISDNTTTINSNAFSYNTDLDWVYIPSSVTSISANAFRSNRYAVLYAAAAAKPAGWNSSWNAASNTYVSATGDDGHHNFSLSSSTLPFYWGVSSLNDIKTNTGSSDPNSGSYQYIIDSLNDITITNYNNNSGETAITIPSVFGSYPVKTIGVQAFAGATNITSVVLPDTNMTTISDLAFAGDTSLTYLGTSGTTYNLPTSLTTIGKYVFNLTKLTKLNIGASTTSIGDRAFFGILTLNDITVSPSNSSFCSDDSVTIGALYSKSSNALISICGSYTGNYTILAGTKTIASYAFSTAIFIPSSGSDVSVIIPDSVTKISDFAFHVYSSIQAATITKILLNNNGTSSLINYIGTAAFGCQTKTTEIDLPNNSSVAKLALYSYAFEYCTSLPTVTFPTTTLINENNTTTVGFAIYLFDHCSALTSLTIPSTIKIIDQYAFYYVTSLTSITFSEGLTSIGNYAFQGCSGLTSLDFPSTLLTIGTYAFESCSGVTSVNFTKCTDLTSISALAFQNCSSISITPSGATATIDLSMCTSLTFIGDHCFKLCTSVVTVKYSPVATTIESYAFESMNSMTSFTNFDSVVTIKSGAFGTWNGGTSHLTSFTLGPSVTLIDSQVFYKSGLQTFSIGSNTILTTINNNAFDSCSSLTSVSFQGNTKLATISTNAFSSCTSMTKFDLGTTNTSLVTIGTYAFNNCTSLTTFVFPSSDTKSITISDNAFDTCRALYTSTDGGTEFRLPSNVVYLGNYAFRNCNSSQFTTLYLPSTVTFFGTQIFVGTTQSTLKVYVDYTYAQYTTIRTSGDPSSGATSGWYGAWNVNGSQLTKTYFYSLSTPTSNDLLPVTAGTISGYWHWSGNTITVW